MSSTSPKQPDDLRSAENGGDSNPVTRRRFTQFVILSVGAGLARGGEDTVECNTYRNNELIQDTDCGSYTTGAALITDIDCANIAKLGEVGRSQDNDCGRLTEQGAETGVVSQDGSCSQLTPMPGYVFPDFACGEASAINPSLTVWNDLDCGIMQGGTSAVLSDEDCGKQSGAPGYWEDSDCGKTEFYSEMKVPDEDCGGTKSGCGSNDLWTDQDCNMIKPTSETNEKFPDGPNPPE
jgi:hypothetical protein